jgi:small G protein signaling modulator 3
VEGMDVLFRVAVAICMINETDLLKLDSISSLYVFLESMTSRMWQADKLIKVCEMCFRSWKYGTKACVPQLEGDLRASISHADLVKKRNAHVSALKACMA